jgi:DNA mismatch repair protein MSH2
MCRDASPGKLGAFEDDLFRNAEMADVPIAAAVILGYPEGARTIGVAFSDTAGRALGACEYADDEYFCATEAVLMQLGAKEVVLPKACPVPLRFSCYISLHLSKQPAFIDS